MKTATAAGDGEESQFSQDLRRAAEGDHEARNRLWAEHYEMLKACAGQWFNNHWKRRGDAHGVSFDGTDIVNEAYARLHARTAAMANGRAFFFRAFYTECMRIVVDHYRKTKNDKGRGPMQRVELQSQFLKEEKVHTDFEIVYEVLAELERQDARVGQVAMLKVFENRPVEGKPGATRGLTNQEVADLLDMGLRTVEKDWAFAKAYLQKRLNERKGE